jgi:hypothetical protein
LAKIDTERVIYVTSDGHIENYNDPEEKVREMSLILPAVQGDFCFMLWNI